MDMWQDVVLIVWHLGVVPFEIFGGWGMGNINPKYDCKEIWLQFCNMQKRADKKIIWQDMDLHNLSYD